jgi:uncharacterized protein
MATRAALAAVAKAFGVPRDSVTLVHGTTSRTKLLDIAASNAHEDLLADRLGQLLKGRT